MATAAGVAARQAGVLYTVDHGRRAKQEGPQPARRLDVIDVGDASGTVLRAGDEATVAGDVALPGESSYLSCVSPPSRTESRGNPLGELAVHVGADLRQGTSPIATQSLRSRTRPQGWAE